MEKTEYNNIWFNWPNIVIEWEWHENHILANIFSKNRVGVQKCQILSPPPFPAMHQPDSVSRDSWELSRHVDKCCTAGLGNS